MHLHDENAFRRLVCRALATTWASTFDEATHPYQHALSARTGMDGFGDGPKCDGRVPGWPQRLRHSVARCLPVHATPGGAFCFLLVGRIRDLPRYTPTGRVRTGRCPYPALFSLGQHDGLEGAAAELQAGGKLLAYLDGLYVITGSSRATEGLALVTSRVQGHCGIASNVGKTRVPGVHELGDEVWRGSRLSGERGFTALGVPLGHPDYVRKLGAPTRTRGTGILGPLAAPSGLAVRVAPVAPVRQHEDQPRSAQHPARRGAALCGSARPRNLRDLEGGRQQRPARFPSLARDPWRLWAAVNCAYGRVLGSLGGLPFGYLRSRCLDLATACADALARGGVGRPAMHRLRPICCRTRVGTICPH